MMDNRKLILSVAKKHYIKKDWYDGWATKTDWQKCIFDGVKEIFGRDTAGNYTDTTLALLNAVGKNPTKEEMTQDEIKKVIFAMDKSTFKFGLFEEDDEPNYKKLDITILIGDDEMTFSLNN